MSGVFTALHVYFQGLRYTLLLNALGVTFLMRAWNCDLWLFGGATYIPRWLCVILGLLLQVPGLFYLGVGAWAVCSSPGARC
jgi:hypothetical protein